MSATGLSRGTPFGDELLVRRAVVASYQCVVRNVATCHNNSTMARPAKITTPFPSVMETAKRLGVSKHDAMVLSEMAERSQKTGVFAIPGLGPVFRVGRKARVRRNPAAGEATEIPAKNVVKFRPAKAAKDVIVPPKK